jgi:exodeoxyribonuclease V alpha subunit
VSGAAALRRLSEAGALEPLEVRFGEAMARLAGAPHDHDLVLAAALACRAPRLGHVYADLADPGAVRFEHAWRGRDERLPWPEAATWLADVAGSRLVAGPGPRPLVLEGSRLYLRRYWEYQGALGQDLKRRARELRQVDAASARATLDGLFPRGPRTPTPDMQRVAAAVAALRGLTVITGGPGTGKTTTVVRLLALLVDQAQRGGRELRVALAAPTGKAAARMAEAIRAGKGAMAVRALDPATISRIPEAASTLHRLLGFQAREPSRFRHDAGNPLPFDVFVVDEASMIPLSLMAKLVDAVPLAARLVLLGDRDQLASVEAGAVLGDICPPRAAADRGARFSAGFAARLAELGVEADALAAPARRQIELALGSGPDPEGDDGSSALADCIVHLSHNYRFSRHGGIGELAAEVNAGRAARALALLRAATEDTDADGQLALVEDDDPVALRAKLERAVLDAYEPVPPGSTEKAALAAMGRLCVLCAHRQGAFGSAQLNRDVERWLGAAGLIEGRGEWYRGRPVIVTQNDYQVGLFNGDLGVALPSTGSRDGFRVVFPSADGPGFREFSPGRLPPHETAFAMTVHKSQGSEFARVVLVLPPHASRILTRELFYTGLTRARERLTVVGPARVVREGIEERIRRASGLREILWGGAG